MRAKRFRQKYPLSQADSRAGFGKNCHKKELGLLLETRLFRLGCIAAAFFMAFWVFWSATPDPEGISIPPPWDKVAHFLYFGTMAFLLAHGVGRRWLIVPLLLVPLIGVLDEWHQAGIPGRDASFFDWLADELGTVAFVAAYWWSSRNRAEVRGPRTE